MQSTMRSPRSRRRRPGRKTVLTDSLVARRMGRPAASHRAFRQVSISLATLVASERAAHPQAWVPPAGVGSITVAVQNLEHTGHFVTDGTFFEVGMSVHNLVEIEGEYAI